MNINNMYKKIDELYAQIDVIKTTLLSNPSDSLIEKLESLEKELNSLHKQIDTQRLEEKRWEVRTGHTTETSMRPFSTKNSVNYVVCDKDVPAFDYICTTQKGYLINYIDKESSELEYSDGRFYGFGYTEEEAIVRAFEYEE
jgi:regulator of replication initiation timing